MSEEDKGRGEQALTSESSINSWHRAENMLA